LIRWRRNGVADQAVLGRYFLMAGAIRFAIEFIRVNDRLVGPLTLAHMISLSLAIVGIVLMAAGPRAAAAPEVRSRRL
jgi:prolipoprotein diacylglyceryltransferase